MKEVEARMLTNMKGGIIKEMNQKGSPRFAVEAGLTPILIITLIALVVGGYLIYQNQSRAKPYKPFPSAAPEIKPSSSQTANWKTYTNTKYGYLLKYPTWLSMTEGGNYSVDGVLVPNQKITSFSVGEDNLKNQEVIREGFQLTIMVDKNINSYTLGQLRDEKLVDQDLKQQGQQPIDTLMIDGEKAYGARVQSAVGMYKIITLHNGELYTFSFESDITNIGKILLSTFKFTDQNQKNFPVIKLNTEYGIPGLPAPSYPPSVSISIPDNLTDQLTAYGAASQVILGPKNWTGQGSVGADGNSGIVLYHQAGSPDKGERIEVFIASTGTGSALYEAASYFPWIQNNWQQLKMPAPAPSPKPGLNTVPVTSHLLKYTLPKTSDDLETNGIIFSNAQDHIKDGMWAASRMEVTMPRANHDLANYLLDYFVRQQGLDKQ